MLTSIQAADCRSKKEPSITSFAFFKIANMKTSLTSIISCSMLLLSSSVTGFCPMPLQQQRAVTSSSSTTAYMFGGAGAGAPTEDNPEQIKQMENAAKSLGMSLEEYQLGIRARMKLNEDLDGLRATGGSASSVRVERDANNPPKHLVVTISESAKAAGKEVVGKDIVTALKSASEQAKLGRLEAQKRMMAFIGEKLKEGEKL